MKAAITTGDNLKKAGPYLKAVEAAGGTALILSPGDKNPLAALQKAQCLLLSGGGDIEPGFLPSGQVTSKVDNLNPLRDRLEFEAFKFALKRGMPVLGICRGMQVMNVALGGDLIQDIPSLMPSALEHRQTLAGYTRSGLSHPVAIVPGSLMHRLYPETPLLVNSLHHQAVTALPQCLQATAFAPDGIIEALEMPGADFVLGVQWHPEELLQDEKWLRLFKRFLGLG